MYGINRPTLQRQFNQWRELWGGTIYWLVQREMIRKLFFSFLFWKHVWKQAGLRTAVVFAGAILTQKLQILLFFFKENLIDRCLIGIWLIWNSQRRAKWMIWRFVSKYDLICMVQIHVTHGMKV